MKNNSIQKSFSIVKIPLIICIAAILFFIAVTNISNAQKNEMRQNLEDALRQSATACYAVEGKYPQSLDYLTKNYGVQIDDDRYNVFYEVIAENLMPNITVTEK
ncbi:MAG: hypothetical protein E7598_03680 [Ruminococcaceae bacterium]|nr:hypothetical protein [Oscillospiraceae bacterium]